MNAPGPSDAKHGRHDPELDASAIIGNIVRQVDQLARQHPGKYKDRSAPARRAASTCASFWCLAITRARCAAIAPACAEEPATRLERKRIQRARNKTRISTEELR
jgi:hypothetical protein